MAPVSAPPQPPADLSAAASGRQRKVGGLVRGLIPRLARGPVRGSVWGLVRGNATAFGVVAVLATALVVLGGVLVGHPSSRQDRTGDGRAGDGRTGEGVQAAAAAGTPTGPTLRAEIAAAQRHLRGQPGDATTWGRLGTAYVEQARITGDPSYYPRAEAALRQAVTTGGGAEPGVLAGFGALAGARHRFAEARDWATRALARDGRSQAAHAVLVDALTQLGDYPAATAAAQRMLDLRPDVSSYTRASYELELHGNVPGARQALERALEAAGGPADVAFCRQYLGELALSTGDGREALRQYGLGVAAEPASGALLAGKARAQAAVGDVAAALRDYATAVARMPLPQYLLEYAELAHAAGRVEEARRNYALVLTQQQLFAAGGATDELFLAQYEADHGDVASAVRHARAEWNRRRSVEVADALAWALARGGAPAEALPYAKIADSLGGRNALFSYHRGMIEKALGHREEARRHLSAALTLGPRFSPLHAPVARQALAELDRAR